LKVPLEQGIAGFRSVVPAIGVYLLSFVFTAIYWVNHDHLLNRIEIADKATVYANLLFLFWLSLLPFFTNYVLEKREDGFSVALYAVAQMLTAFAFLLLRLAVLRRLSVEGELEPQDNRGKLLHVASVLAYIVPIVIARWHSDLALVLSSLVAVPWIFPNVSAPGCPSGVEAANTQISNL